MSCSSTLTVSATVTENMPGLAGQPPAVEAAAGSDAGAAEDGGGIAGATERTQPRPSRFSEPAALAELIGMDSDEIGAFGDVTSRQDCLAFCPSLTVDL